MCKEMMLSFRGNGQKLKEMRMVVEVIETFLPGDADRYNDLDTCTAHLYKDALEGDVVEVLQNFEKASGCATCQMLGECELPGMTRLGARVVQMQRDAR